METADRRSAARRPITIVVELHWKMRDGSQIRHFAPTHNVSRTGALLEVRDFWRELSPNDEVAVSVESFLWGGPVQGRVVSIRQLGAGKKAAVAVELLEPLAWDAILSHSTRSALVNV